MPIFWDLPTPNAKLTFKHCHYWCFGRKSPMVISSQSFDHIEKRVPVKVLRGVGHAFRKGLLSPHFREGPEMKVVVNFPKGGHPYSGFFGFSACARICRIFSKGTEGVL